MSKVTNKKNSTQSRAKVPSAFVDKTVEPAMAADNDSKYQPSADALFSTQMLGQRDAVLKFFADSIKDLYWAENHLVKSLPKMIKAASNKALSTAITNHLKQTENHVKRLEKVFELLSLPPQARKCDAMEGLTKEGEAVIECTEPGTAVRDLGIILASQKVEHYEISSYTGLINLAQRLEAVEIVQILSETLTEEQESDETLATVADQIEIAE